MKMRLTACSLLLVMNISLLRAADYRPAKVSFDDFKELVAAVEPHRAKRLVGLDEFLKMSREPNTIVLDSRSDFRYDRIHLKGARHLSFTDFTQENLEKVIPDFNTRILIYCNNNFDGNQTDFTSKVARRGSRLARNPIEAQMQAQAKPRMMALNIPTYVNLFGYGYENVYELAELVDVTDPRITLEGTVAKK
ncbi:rhodanese-like domain-containing protein [bacterium]|nr:MAG: rhodanese-like domain-containing protein [bacterium]